MKLVRPWAVRGLALLILAVTAPAGALEVEQYTIDETANGASTIFVGHALSHRSRWGDASERWIMTDYTFEVEDVLFSDGNVQPGGTLTLSFWGGTIGDETQRIAGFDPPVDGNQYVLMLRPDFASGAGFSPCVAFTNGFFIVANDLASGGPTVLDADRQPLVNEGGRIDRQSVVESDSAQTGVSLSEFLDYLRANMKRIKNQPARQPQGLAANNPAAMPTFAKEGLVEPRQLGNGSPPSESTLPLEQSAPGLAAPVKPEGAETAVMVHAQIENGHGGGQRNDPNWSRTSMWQNLPIVVNSFQDSFPHPWFPEDQFQMSKWNYYANIYVVRNPRTGTYAWGDGINDLAGWPSSADLQRVYGQPWDAGTLAVTFQRTSGGWLIEADIALNPAYGWTVDDAADYLDTTTAWPYRRSMLHEMGHMWGVDHQFNFLSVMNYPPKVFRAYGIPFMDDAEGVRATYSSRLQSRNDLGAYMFRSTGFQAWSAADFPGSVVAGNAFNLNNFHIENVGTTTINSPTLEFYLSSDLDWNHSYYFLRTVNYSPPLARFGWYNPASVGVSLTVPTYVNGGDYFVADFIRNDDGAPVGSFPWDNNSGFTRTKIRVYPRVTSVSLSPSTVAGGSSSLGRVNLGSNAGPGGITIFLSSNNTSVATVPFSVFIPAGSSTTTFNVTTVGVPSTRTVSISASSNGVTEAATLTVLPPALTSVSLTPSIVTGGSSSLGRVNLGSNAGPGGLSVSLFSSNPSVATVPASVLVPSGSSTATFPINTVGVPTTSTPLITASSNGTNRSATLTVLAPELASVALDPDQVAGGGLSTGTVYLGSNAGPGGLTVDLSSSDPSVASVAPSVTIPEGFSSASFVVSSGIVLVRSAAMITATSNGASRSATLTVTSPTGISVTNVAGSPGDTVIFSGTLIRFADGAGLPGQTVTFFVDAYPVDNAITDDSGVALLQVTIPDDFPLGDHVITMQFAGDSNYEPSTADGTLSVN